MAATLDNTWFLFSKSTAPNGELLGLNSIIVQNAVFTCFNQVFNNSCCKDKEILFMHRGADANGNAS